MESVMPHAIQIRQTGGPELLSWTPIEVGEPRSGQVRLRPAADGINNTGCAGLGLSIVRDLAAAMEATVDLGPRATGGTRFTLNLQRSRNRSAS